MVKRNTRRRRGQSRNRSYRYGGKYNHKKIINHDPATQTLEEAEEEDQMREDQRINQLLIELVQNRHDPVRWREIFAQLPIEAINRFMGEVMNEIQQRQANQ
jgi:hypothetical protein